MSTTQDRLRGRLETLERVKAPDGLGVLVIPTGVRVRIGKSGFGSTLRADRSSSFRKRRHDHERFGANGWRSG